jgi:hypothetical protein
MYKSAVDIASDNTDHFVRSACFRVGFLDNGAVPNHHGPQTVGAIQKQDRYSEFPYGFASIEDALAGLEVLRAYFGYSKATQGAVVVQAETSQGPMSVCLRNRAHFRRARLWGAAAELASTVPDYTTPHRETSRRRPDPSLAEGADSGCFGCLEAGHALDGHSQCSPTKAQAEALRNHEGTPSYESHGWVWHPAPRIGTAQAPGTTAGQTP